mmetsp:Transcript_7560/g.22211  ORF Transcript_7560/g.22211 Transcript_7560/m.22211 type:complete len:202 (+) Transcript_7560:267-872(+)
MSCHARQHALCIRAMPFLSVASSSAASPSSSEQERRCEVMSRGVGRSGGRLRWSHHGQRPVTSRTCGAWDHDSPPKVSRTSRLPSPNLWDRRLEAARRCARRAGLLVANHPEGALSGPHDSACAQFVGSHRYCTGVDSSPSPSKGKDEGRWTTPKPKGAIISVSMRLIIIDDRRHQDDMPMDSNKKVDTVMRSAYSGCPGK